MLQLLGDITKKDVCEELVDKTLNHFGELDVLVSLKKPKYSNVRQEYHNHFRMSFSTAESKVGVFIKPTTIILYLRKHNLR